MKKLNIRGSSFLRGVWSYTWRWTLILLCMLVCCYWIHQLIGFSWWLVTEKSGTVKILFGTVVIGVFCAVLQVLVGVLIFQFGQKKLIAPLLRIKSVKGEQEDMGKYPRNVFNEPLLNVFGERVNPKFYREIPFPWKKVETLWDIPVDAESRNIVLFFREDKVTNRCMITWAVSDDVIHSLQANIRLGHIPIGWCYQDYLCDFLCDHSVVPEV